MLLEKLSKKCFRLRKLMICCNISDLSPNEFVQLIHSFTNLEKLFIIPPVKLNREHILQLEKHPKLKEVILMGKCTDEAEYYIEKDREMNHSRMFIKVIIHGYKFSNSW
ncbi:4714_t:CDS:2, partial [Scutellospora calospora]